MLYLARSVVVVDCLKWCFQPFQWSGTLCSNFDSHRTGDSCGPKDLNSKPNAENGGRILGKGEQQTPSPPARAPIANTFWIY